MLRSQALTRSRHPCLLAPLAVVTTILLSSPLLANTLHVCPIGCAFSTIQGGIDAAASGDTVLIAAGRYAEDVTIIGKRLTLIGAGAGAVTQLVGSGRGPVIVLGSGSGSSYEEVDIQNLTVSGGSHQSGTGVGGGVQVRRGAFLHLLNSIVAQNSALYGGGIGVNTPGGPATTVSSCLVDDNVATGANALGGGGIVVVEGSTVVVKHSTITRNRAFNGGGIYSDSATQLSISGTTVSENSVTSVHVHLGFVGGTGGGIQANSNLTLADSLIANNSATGEEQALGGGLFVVLGGTETLERTIIAHNSALGVDGAAGDGGGVFVAAPNNRDTLTLTQVYVVENQASQGSAGGVSNEGTLVLSDTVIRDNSGLDCHGGFGCPH